MVNAPEKRRKKIVLYNEPDDRRPCKLSTSDQPTEDYICKNDSVKTVVQGYQNVQKEWFAGVQSNRDICLDRAKDCPTTSQKIAIRKSGLSLTIPYSNLPQNQMSLRGSGEYADTCRNILRRSTYESK